MMKYIKFIYTTVIGSVLLLSCNKDVLDRKPLTKYVDAAYWRNEQDVRLHANGYYMHYFPGFNYLNGIDYTPVLGYNFNDDLTSKNVQTLFENNVPASRSSTSEATSQVWLSQYAGPTWNFAWVRKSNIFIDRVENVAKSNLSTEAYSHWMAVARFFRGFEYSRLVSVWGDIPYYDRPMDPDNPEDVALLYKDRDNRGVVMDKVYDDFKYVMANIRVNDGAQNLNKYIAAAFISRFMLFEGTYQHYHNLDAARAKKYLEFAVEAADFVITSNKYNFTKDFKSIFTSESLAGHPEVLIYRAYDATLGVTHAIGSSQNGTESSGGGVNLVLIKSFVTSDGKVQDSSPLNATNFTIANLTKTLDPRFEATFYQTARTQSPSLLYGFKFASREALTYIGKTYPAAWGGSTNSSDAPVMRLAEVVLNYVEAKAVLAEYYSGPAVTQADLEKSINAIRNRPLDADATSKGVKKTAKLLLNALPVDPARDADVPALIWEIRRERRMEFVFEEHRLKDLRRWKKLNYMDYGTNPDYFLGPWVNLQTEAPTLLTTATAATGRVKVKKADGTIVTWNGSNATAMTGFYMIEAAANRNAFTDRAYLAPVGLAQINDYKEKGYTLTQTKGW